MIWRILGLLIAACVGIILLYLSPFWPLELWDRKSELASLGFRPKGDMVSHWLRGTPFAPFNLLIWVVGVFLVLTWMQTGLDRLSRPKE